MKRLFFYFFFVWALGALPMLSAQEERKQETVQNEQSSVVVTVVGDTVRIQNVAPGSLVEVYNILGVKVTSMRAESADKTIILNLQKGYYIFKIGDVVRKVVVK